MAEVVNRHVAAHVRGRLLLARSEGISLDGRNLHEVGQQLGHSHSLMGRALQPQPAAGGSRKVELLRGLDADVVVDYLEPDWTERVTDAVDGVDVVFDGVGGAIGRAAFELLDRGGRRLSIGSWPARSSPPPT